MSEQIIYTRDYVIKNEIAINIRNLEEGKKLQELNIFPKFLGMATVENIDYPCSICLYYSTNSYASVSDYHWGDKSHWKYVEASEVIKSNEKPKEPEVGDYVEVVSLNHESSIGGHQIGHKGIVLPGITRSANGTALLKVATKNGKDYWFVHKSDLKVINKQEKQPEMKKIIGYKLLKDLPGLKAGPIFTIFDDEDYYENKENEYKFDQKDVEDKEWFEPVYESQFKAGDEVVVTGVEFRGTNFGCNGLAHKVGRVGKITHIRDKMINTDSGVYWVGLDYTAGGISSNQIRLATEKDKEAWEKVEPIQIEHYESELESLNGEKVVAFGCVKLTRQRLEAYKYLLESQAVVTITVRRVTITVEIIDKLIKKLDESK